MLLTGLHPEKENTIQVSIFNNFEEMEIVSQFDLPKKHYTQAVIPKDPRENKDSIILIMTA